MSDFDEEEDGSFGGKASFLFRFGGDIFGNGATDAFRCRECQGVFAETKMDFKIVVGIYFDRDAPKRHREDSSILAGEFGRLVAEHGKCTCAYHRPSREASWFPFPEFWRAGPAISRPERQIDEAGEGQVDDDDA